ncbi:hypothetical protein CRG98_039322 [Punica granatum]|uniref:Uncharacterized protein n=1 Tax=Punica granatum TaxID=22663 RepID=A0A2I0I8H3_PUNGR|nr:hypothetical protein CRG98_039322 [Punica granatum]
MWGLVPVPLWYLSISISPPRYNKMLDRVKGWAGVGIVRRVAVLPEILLCLGPYVVRIGIAYIDSLGP